MFPPRHPEKHKALVYPEEHHPPHNRISFLLAGHMLELLDGPAGLKWLEIEERNHPGLIEVEELRTALENPPEGFAFCG